MKPARPIRLTVAGGACVGTFAIVDKAREKAERILTSGQANVVWLRHRDEQVYERLTLRPLHLDSNP